MWDTKSRYIYIIFSERLVSAKTNVHVFISAFLSFFFFFFQRMNNKFIVQRQKLLFMHCSNTVHVLQQYCSHIKNIKNGSHGTFHIFKNYFATVFSVFSFSNNKFNPNGLKDQHTTVRTHILYTFKSKTIKLIKIIETP